MATPKIFAIVTSVIFLLSLFQKVDANQITNRDVSNLLSLLNRKIAGNKKPVIIILEKGSGQAFKNKPDQLTSSEEHDPINVPHYFHEKFNKNKLIKKSTPSYLNLLQQGQKNRLRYGPQKTKLIDSYEEVDKRVLRSPIVKKLLRISNTIQCEAKDDCEDKCQNKHRGKKVFTCQIQCEAKYDCDEKVDKDPCESGCDDSCGNSNECTMSSTKGERLVPEDNQCKRC